MNMLMKAADVSNEVRPFDVSMSWITCLSDEFSDQFDLETAIGIPNTPFMNMKQISKASSQIGFIKFVLLPLFEALTLLFPVAKDTLLGQIHQALAYWLQVEEHMSTVKETPDTATRLKALMAELRSYDLTPSNITLHASNW